MKKIALFTLAFSPLLHAAHPSLSYSDSASFKGLAAIVGIGITGGVAKFIGKSKWIETKTGVSSGEAAATLGLMGGFFALGATNPELMRYGWLVPVLWATYKIANSSIVSNYFLSNIPSIGEHLAGPDVIETRKNLLDQKSIVYNPGLPPKTNEDGSTAKPFVLKAENVGKVLFATVATTAFLYVPVKFGLEKILNYPDCCMNWSGKLFDKIASKLAN